MSKTLYIYASGTGAVEKCARYLNEKIGGEATLCNLMKPAGPVPSPENYDNVIMGASLHAGKIQKKAIDYGRKNSALLQTKKLGLYLCSMTPPAEAEKNMETAFPSELSQAASAKGLFGGAVYFDKMNGLSRFIMKKITKKSESFEAFDEKRMDDFAALFN